MKPRKRNDSPNNSLRIKPWPIATAERFENEAALCDAQEIELPAASAFVRSRIRSRSRRQISLIARKFAAYLRETGVGEGHKVIVDLPVCADIFSIWTAILYAGAIPVFLPIDRDAQTAREAVRAASEENGTPVLVISALSRLVRNAAIPTMNLPISAIVYIDDMPDQSPADDDIAVASPETAAKIPMTSFGRAIDLYDGYRETRRIAADMPIAVTYSQGTGGCMRAIEIPNAVIETQAQEISEILNLTKESVVFCDFPAIHTMLLSVMSAAFLSGAQFAVALPPPDMRSPSECRAIADALAAIKPTHAFLRPHILSGIMRRIQSPDAGALRNKWRNLCLRVGKFKTRNTNRLMNWSHPLIRSACTRPIKDHFFPRIEAIVSYGNHFAPKDAELLSFLDIPIYNAYAVAEFGIAHMHAFKGEGSFLKSIEAKIKNGNLCIRHKKAAPAFADMRDLVFEDARCGLCTRPNAWVTLASGRAIDTSPLRDALRRNAVIENAFIFGDGMPFLTALVYLRPDAARAVAAQLKLPQAPFEEYAKNPKIYEHVRAIVQSCNLTRAPYESIRKFAVIPLAIEDDPNMLTLCKTARAASIAARHAPILQSFYADNF